MSGFFGAIIICILISFPILGAIIGVRAILKKPIKKLALSVAICAASIIPFTILGVITDPATWCDHQWGVVETVEAKNDWILFAGIASGVAAIGAGVAYGVKLNLKRKKAAK